MYAYVGSYTTPDRDGHGDGINVYHVEADSGRWTHVQLLGDLANPSFLAFDREQRFLYSVHGARAEISAFRIDRATGRLSFLNSQPVAGTNPVHLAPDKSNRFFVVANYATGTVAALRRNRDGALGAVTSVVELPGRPGPHRVEQVSSHPHDCPFDPGGDFILVPDKGLDRIFTFRLDTTSGRLLPGPDPFVESRENAGPRHIGFHPSAAYAYVINELDSTIACYRYDRARGRLDGFQLLSSLPDSYMGNSRASEILVAPSGKFVYASNRGHDSVGIFAIDQATGRLSPAGWEATHGATPRFITLDPAGKRLYSANQDSHNIVAFGVDPSHGTLALLGEVAAVGSPACIIFSDF